jgi:hypothetical protein
MHKAQHVEAGDKVCNNASLLPGIGIFVLDKSSE